MSTSETSPGQPRSHVQWIQLLRDFHHRPERLLHLRLTVVHEDKDFLAKMPQLLCDEADELDIAFQFHYAVGQLETLDFNDLHSVLELKSGEARAIICTLQLHRLLAAADDTLVPTEQGYDPYHSPATPLSFVSPPASTPQFHMPPQLVSFLSTARALSPKIMVVTEQDANHNGVSFRKRFAEALHYYAAVYDSLDAAAAAFRRPADERAVLGEEIRGVLLRVGAHRQERHDRLQQWEVRWRSPGSRTCL
ncbi:scarecrow-like protein 3 [Phragmites australis]|uniref:scarecrow-like protein 3 n=1 Tax=Phragmites australis TaxID=29695 RepID=UPI002D77F2F5|nr:scarecrow-like protein 3 [Phragmites australis]